MTSSAHVPPHGTQPGDMPLRSERPIIRFNKGQATPVEDVVATEYALTIHVNNREMATVVCSPEYLNELVLGFLASEGVIRSMDQVTDLSIVANQGTARVTTSTSVNFNQEFFNKRYIASCCGKSRQSFYFYNDAHTAKYIEDAARIQPEQIFAWMEEMESNADLFRSTGGVHVAAMADTAQGVLFSRADIGRHNALDKMFGHALLNRISMAGKVIVFSGRLSSEVLLKVAKIGAGIVIAKSAPTALALDIAEELNITTVGFVRNEGFNVYTHPERIYWG